MSHCPQTASALKRIRHVPSNSHRSRNRALSTEEPGMLVAQQARQLKERSAGLQTWWVLSAACIEQVEDHGMSHNPLRIALMALAQGEKVSKGKEKKLLRKEVSL